MSSHKRGPRALPPHVRDAARRSRCDDCSSEVKVRWDPRLGAWRTNVLHDHGCVQLAWRRKHGALTGAVLVAEQGRTVPPELVTQLASETQKATGADAVRVSLDPESSALSWQERQAVDEWSES